MTRFAPEFVTRTDVRVVPVRTTRAGAAVSATGVGVPLAPGNAKGNTNAQSASPTEATVTDRLR
jgi:hypothetical protein